MLEINGGFVVSRPARPYAILFGPNTLTSLTTACTKKKVCCCHRPIKCQLTLHVLKVVFNFSLSYEQLCDFGCFRRFGGSLAGMRGSAIDEEMEIGIGLRKLQNASMFQAQHGFSLLD